MSLSAIRNVDYVILLCEKIAVTAAFYRDVLGFRLEDETESWIRLRVGSTFLTLRPRGRWRSWHDGAAVAGSAAVQLAFQVTPEEVLSCHEELVAKGVDIIEEPGDQAFGHRTLFFRDPEGNVLEIFAEIPKPAGPV